jgi:hypothetical protein
MNNRKPTFLDCPPRYTRTPRSDQSPVEYASALEYKDTGYTPAWWAALLVLTIIALFVIVATA